jgi:uncharacterized protein YfaA (DUF2138 family)
LYRLQISENTSLLLVTAGKHLICLTKNDLYVVFDNEQKEANIFSNSTSKKFSALCEA